MIGFCQMINLERECSGIYANLIQMASNSETHLNTKNERKMLSNTNWLFIFPPLSVDEKTISYCK